MMPTVVATMTSAAAVVMVGWWSSWRLAPVRHPACRERTVPHEPTPAARRSMIAAMHLSRPRRDAGEPDDQTLAAWCQHVAGRLRVGSSLPVAFDDACEHVAPVGDAFAPVRHGQARGASLSHALARVAAHGDSLRLVLATVRTCARLGGPAAEPLDRTAATLHARAAARAERRVHSAQAEMSAKLLTALPLAVLGLLAAADPNVRAALTRPPAQLCLVIGLALNGLGWWWMRRVIASSRRRYRLRPRRRAADDANRALPDGIEVLVACLHAGLTPPQLVDGAIEDLPEPLQPAFRAVRDRMQRGHRFADAIGELPAQLGPSAHALADSIAAADRYGLALGPTLDRLAFEAAQSRRRLGEADARRLPIRLSFPLVVATLPSFVLIAIAPAVLGALSSLTVPAV